MCVKEQNFNTQKIAEAVALLDLITKLRMKSCTTNKGKIEIRKIKRRGDKSKAQQSL